MSIALIALWIALGAVLLTTALTTSLRAFGALTAARRERYRSEISEQLVAFAVGASENPPPPPTGRLQQRVFDEELARLAANLKGDSRELLARLFERYGLVDSVARDLRSDHSLTAIRAAELAGVMHAAECAPILLERLGGDPLVRLASARALSEIGVVEAMPQIVAALATQGNAIELGEILMSFGAQVQPLLRERLRGAPTVEERRIAAVTLGEMHAHPAVDDLIDALADEDPEVEAAAARALGQIGERSASAPLVAQIERPGGGFPSVAAASALGTLDDPSAAPALVRALDDDDWDLRNAAARSLAGFGERGLAQVAAGLGSMSPRAVAHFAGVLDVAGRLGTVIEAAAAGDPGMDRLVRAACATGVRSRLRERACGGPDSVSGYALSALREATERA